MQEIKKSKLKLNILLNTFYQILKLITPLLTAPYISRVLQNDGVGVYSYTFSLVTFFVMFASLGTITYGTRMIALNRDDKNEYSKSFWEIELLTVITSSVMLSLWIIMAFLYTEYKIYLLILSFQILATCFDISWLYAGLEKYKYTVGINSIFKIVSVVSTFLFVKTKDDLWIYTLICSCELLLGNLSMWLFLPKMVSKIKISLKNIGHHFKETLIYFIPTIATTIYTVLDKTLIGVLITGEVKVIEDGKEVIKKASEVENGYYEQATKIINMLKAVTFASINGVMESRASYLYGKNNEEGVKRLLKITLTITIFLSIGALFGISAIASTFVPLFFGEGYSKTVILIYLLSSLVFIVCISNVLGSLYYTPSGRRKQSSLFLVIGSVINFALNIPLILLFDSIGAAIASIIAEIVISVLYIVKSNNMLTWKMLFLLSWKKIIAGAIMFVIIFFFGKLLNEYMNDYLLIVCQIALGAICYVGILLLIKDDSCQKFVTYIKGMIKKKDNQE